MPLRDHFRSPLDDQRHWEAMHATWPVLMAIGLRQKLPPGYFAEPSVHSMPLWLADDLAIPLDLEKSYKESCNGLGIR